MAKITTAEAAAKLGVSQRTIIRYIVTGKVRGHRYGDRGAWLVESRDLGRIEAGRSPHDPLLTPEFLDEVGRKAGEHLREGRSPRRELAAEYGRAPGTVDRWIAAAREHGSLAPVHSGRSR